VSCAPHLLSTLPLYATLPSRLPCSAAASLGQVYRGVLRSTGEAVAVKVQRPGVAASIALDVFVLRQVGTSVRGWRAGEGQAWVGFGWQAQAGGLNCGDVPARKASRVAVAGRLAAPYEHAQVQ